MRRPGSNVDAWCTKCKLILAHTIEALVGNDIKRVHCNTCMSKHAYRQYAPGEAPRKAKERAENSPIKPKRLNAGVVRASDYEGLLRGRDLFSAKPYSFREIFGEGDVLDHKTFGTGIVVGDLGMNKIEVLFPEGPKVLIHARA